MISPVSHRVDETNMTSKKLLRRSLAGILALLLVFFGTATAAFAHDAVTETSPSDGSTVATVPAEIQITLSNTPAVIGSQILVFDEAGTNWASGDVQVLDKAATQALRSGAPAGKYTVQWRLVSSDSHPIEGTFSFTATAAGSGSAASTGAGAGAGPVVSVQAQPEPQAEPVPDSSAVPWSIVGLVVVLLGVVVAMVVVARRRLSSED